MPIQILTEKDRKDIQNVLDRMEGFFDRYFAQPFDNLAGSSQVWIAESLGNHNINTYNKVHDVFEFVRDNVIKWPAEKVKNIIKGLVEGTLSLWKATKNVCGKVGQAIMGEIRSCLERISNIFKGKDKEQTQEQVIFDGLEQLPLSNVVEQSVSTPLAYKTTTHDNVQIINSLSKNKESPRSPEANLNIATVDLSSGRGAELSEESPRSPGANLKISPVDLSSIKSAEPLKAASNSYAAKEKKKKKGFKSLGPEEQAAYNKIYGPQSPTKQRQTEALKYRENQRRKLPGAPRGKY